MVGAAQLQGISQPAYRHSVSSDPNQLQNLTSNLLASNQPDAKKSQKNKDTDKAGKQKKPKSKKSKNLQSS